MNTPAIKKVWIVFGTHYYGGESSTVVTHGVFSSKEAAEERTDSKNAEAEATSSSYSPSFHWEEFDVDV